MPAWRKWLRAGVSITGKGLGILVGTAPVHRGVKRLAGGDFEGAAEAIVFDTAGLSIANPEWTPDVQKLIRTGVLVGVGIGIMKLFSYMARRV